MLVLAAEKKGSRTCGEGEYAKTEMDEGKN